MAGSGSILGNAVLRLEDPTLLTGEGKYVDDLVETGHAHVGARPVDASPTAPSSRSTSASAASMPGVVAVYHAGDDLGMPSFQGFAMMPPDFNRPIFASEQVRFVGDVIAAVVAEIAGAGQRRGRGGDRRHRSAAGRHDRRRRA